MYDTLYMYMCMCMCIYLVSLSLSLSLYIYIYIYIDPLSIYKCPCPHVLGGKLGVLGGS